MTVFQNSLDIPVSVLRERSGDEGPTWAGSSALRRLRPPRRREHAPEHHDAVHYNFFLFLAQSVGSPGQGSGCGSVVERLLPTPEVCGSIPIGDNNNDQYSTNCNLEKTKIKKKRAGMVRLYKKACFASSCVAKHIFKLENQ